MCKKYHQQITHFELNIDIFATYNFKILSYHVFNFFMLKYHNNSFLKPLLELEQARAQTRIRELLVLPIIEKIGKQDNIMLTCK